MNTSSGIGVDTMNEDTLVGVASAVKEDVTPSVVDMTVEMEKIFGRYYCSGIFSTIIYTSYYYGCSSTGLFSFQFSFMDGLDVVLENGPWFIRNNPLILKKWHPDENLMKEDISTVPVWVKLHGVPVTGFSEDGLSVIATKLGQAMIELRADVELKDNIIVAMPKLTGEGHYICAGEKKTLKKPSQSARGVSVGLKMGFKPQKEYRPVPKKSTASSSGNKNKGVVPTIEVSNSNPFEFLNSVDNDGELGTNKGTTNLVNNRATSSGSFFMNVDNSSTRTTPISDKIGKSEELLTSGQAILVDEAGNPLKKVEFSGDYDSEDEVASVYNDMARSMASERIGFGTQSLLEQWRDSYGNGDYDEDSYDDDMYEGQDLPQELQAICDNLDIRVRGRSSGSIDVTRNQHDMGVGNTKSIGHFQVVTGLSS
ncbi:RNA-directed DNA polymerase, eukaryota, reverse transcriptase zinc-binding domain protein [Tanacetum coccineum]